ncbi:MAG TPA: class I SAM-dependent methyltransferase [Gammaproteobacteria bacterium]|nr:class I SAM-dependent methyltransferase [Gammaproteobacteria bacterium]
MHYLRHLARLGTPDIHPGGAQATRALIEALILRDGQRLLELGCGTGNTILRLVSKADVHVVGLDLLSEMLLVARRRLSVSAAAGRCALVQGSVSVLPFFDQSFDRVYTESVLGMLAEADVRGMLAETFRVLKPGGLFLANEAIWKPHVDQSMVNAVNRQGERDFGLRHASEQAWSVDRWLDEIRGAGFQPLAWKHLPAKDRNGTLRSPVALWIRRLRLVSSPALLREHRRYRQRLVQHRADGSLIEARLFVSAKPS